MLGDSAPVPTAASAARRLDAGKVHRNAAFASAREGAPLTPICVHLSWNYYAGIALGNSKFEIYVMVDFCMIRIDWIVFLMINLLGGVSTLCKYTR